MVARRLYDNTICEVNNSPLWLKKKYPGCIYYRIINQMCYSFKEYDHNKGATQDKTYNIGNKLYVAEAIMTKSQFEILDQTHSKCDGYIKMKIWEYLSDF